MKAPLRNGAIWFVPPTLGHFSFDQNVGVASNPTFNSILFETNPTTPANTFITEDFVSLTNSAGQTLDIFSDELIFSGFVPISGQTIGWLARPFGTLFLDMVFQANGTDKFILHGDTINPTDTVINVPNFAIEVLPTPVGVVAYNANGDFGPLTFAQLAAELTFTIIETASLSYKNLAPASALDDPTENAFTRVADTTGGVPVWEFFPTPGSSYRVSMKTIGRDNALVTGDSASINIEYIVVMGPVVGATPVFAVIQSHLSALNDLGFPGTLAGSTLAIVTAAGFISFSPTIFTATTEWSTRIDVERVPVI